MRISPLFLSLVVLAAWLEVSAQESPSPDFAKVEALFKKYCAGCHHGEDPDGGLSLESRAGALAGGESGEALVPGKSGESRIVLQVERKLKPFMPPKDEPRPTDAEWALVKAWIDAGAPAPAAPAAAAAAAALVTPRIAPRVPPRRALRALAFSPDGRILAAARHGEVELLETRTRSPLRTLEGHTGSVAALSFSSDGSVLAAAAGEPGLFGEARLWPLREGGEPRVLRGHRDSLYSIAISPDGRTLATGSYDQKIVLWDLDRGVERQTLGAHNGAIFGLAFRMDGKVLASASADRTVKLWRVADGARLDTLSQATRELHAVAFSPDGRRLAAAGVDNRIRVWSVSAEALEGSNPLLVSRFAHEGAILQLAYSADGRHLLSTAEDRTVKLWEAEAMAERHLLEVQSDWPSAAAFAPDGGRFAIGRLDGSLSIYETSTGGELRVARAPAPAAAAFAVLGALIAPESGQPAEAKAPELASIWPRGAARGATARIELQGKHLDGLSAAHASHAGLGARLLAEPAPSAERAWIELSVAADAPLGDHEIWVSGPGGASARWRVQVDSIPQHVEREGAAPEAEAALPAAFWGAIGASGDRDSFAFQASKGQRLIFDCAAARLGSKANLVLSILDPLGRLLHSVNDFDGDLDPLAAFDVPADGRYLARIEDIVLGASPEHFYRLTVGELPFVTGCFPLGVPAGKESELLLAGYNLPPGAAARVRAGEGGEVEVPIDAERFRSRRGFKAAVSPLSVLESEPNDAPESATPLPIPGVAEGRIERAAGRAPGDADLFRIRVRAGEAWILETEAARRGSPIDTRIEVLSADGLPLERLLLQAVRDSNVTFRPIDSNSADVRLTNWEEMELNQFLYFQGEVARIFRMPQGPDSGFNLYSRGGARLAYFDTSATAHANEEPVYVVEAHAPGTRLVPNGLPTFVLHYQNDDDGERRLGRDSKLVFTAPADGEYLVRVSDARGFGGDRFAYRLSARRPEPDFRPSLGGAGPTIQPGSGKSFSLSIERLDGFDGEVRFDIEGLPPGFTVATPLVVEAGHTSASGTLWAAADAPAPAPEAAAASKVRSRAVIGGREVVKEAGSLGAIRVEGKAQVTVDLYAIDGAPGRPGKPAEITVVPGRRVPARLRIERHDFTERVTFDVENLPHGVIVDDIGLNGILIPPEETERTIFLHCASWVPAASRLAFARSREAGGQTSLPVLIHVAAGSAGDAGASGCGGGDASDEDDKAGEKAKESPSALEADASGWVDLQPGKDLKGWHRVVLPGDPTRPEHPWSVSEDAKVLRSKGKDVKELFLHETERGDGVFHVEWRVAGDAKEEYNGGVYVRTRKDGKVWHQAQVAMSAKRPVVGDLFADVEKGGKIERVQALSKLPSRARPVGEWNVLEVACRGKRITVWVNGAVTVEWDACEEPKGLIGLQVEFYDLEFRSLKFKPAR
jgi:WD40 repeat protein